MPLGEVPLPDPGEVDVGRAVRHGVEPLDPFYAGEAIDVFGAAMQRNQIQPPAALTNALTCWKEFAE